MIKYVEAMYSNTSMRVRAGTKISEPFKSEGGVRQGCPMPLLFNIYIDDLLDNKRPVEIEGLNAGLRGLMFADDTVISAEDVERHRSTNRNTTSVLQCITTGKKFQNSVPMSISK